MDTPNFGSLKEAVALATASGYKIIYDNRHKSTQPPFNITGAVCLSKWPGLTGKNGGGYEYAFTGTTIIARPTLPPDHGMNLRPKDNKETLEVLRQAAQILEEVGPTAEFLLAGND
jgi:hypothetical protein